MKRRSKAVIAIVGLVCVCIACIWLWPYIWYVFLVSSFSSAAQGRIHCWIKVVDQNKIGISGYKLRIVEHHAPLLPFVSSSGRVRILNTQKDGVLEYKSRGPVGVVYIGYDHGTQWRINPKTLIQSGYITLTTLEHRKEIKDDPTGYLGSKNNPYLLHVFSVGKPQKLLYWSRRIMLKNEDDYACMDILSGKVWESKSPKGDIAMRDYAYEQGKPDPRCTISFVAGKGCMLFPVVDDWGLGPPKQEYKRNLCWSKDWMDIRRRAYNRIQVYFLLRNANKGKTLYGRIDFGVWSYVNHAIIECFTNLQGKRNLYFQGYLKSRSTFDPGQIQNYVSPPVKLEDLAAAQEKGK